MVSISTSPCNGSAMPPSIAKQMHHFVLAPPLRVCKYRLFISLPIKEATTLLPAAWRLSKVQMSLLNHLHTTKEVLAVGGVLREHFPEHFMAADHWQININTTLNQLQEVSSSRLLLLLPSQSLRALSTQLVMVHPHSSLHR